MKRTALVTLAAFSLVGCHDFTEPTGNAPISGPVFETASSLSSACVQPPQGLVSWWPGDGDADDIQNANNGVLTNGAMFAAGHVGQAFSFDGTDDYVFVGNPANLQLTEGVTVDAWVFYSQDLPVGQYATIAGKWGWTVPTDAYLLTSVKTAGAYKLVFGIGDGASPDGGVRGGEISTNTWTHIAGTYDASTGVNVVYVNGAQVGSRIRSGGIHSSAINVIIGAQDRAGGAPFRFFPGLIDEVEIFNRALSALEIQAIYDAGPAGKCKSPPTPEEQLQALLDEILASADLNGNVVGALASKLENVIAKLDQDNVGAAINQLQAFINQVEALIQAGQLAQPDGGLLIDVAQGVIDELSA